MNAETIDLKREKKMKCRKVLNNLTAYLENQLADRQKNEFEQHLYQCSGCLTKLKGVQKILSNVNPEANIPIPPDYYSQLHRKLVQLQMEKAFKHRHPLMSFNFLKPALAGGFGMLFVFFGLFYFTHKQTAVKQIPSDSEQANYLQTSLADKNSFNVLKLNQDGTLQINLNALNTINNANFEIELPEGLCRIKGKDIDCENKLISWRRDLEKGKNIIYLHVRGTEEGVWNVKVKLEKNTLIKRMELPVSVKEMQKI